MNGCADPLIRAVGHDGALLVDPAHAADRMIVLPPWAGSAEIGHSYPGRWRGSLLSRVRHGVPPTRGWSASSTGAVLAAFTRYAEGRVA